MPFLCLYFLSEPLWKDSRDDRILCQFVELLSADTGDDVPMLLLVLQQEQTKKCGCTHMLEDYLQIQHIFTHLSSHRRSHKMTSHWLLGMIQKNIRSCEEVKSLRQYIIQLWPVFFYHSLDTHPLAGPQTVSWWQFSSLPSKTMALISPNSGTSSGPPCIAELSPARSRSWTKLSEYCWTLDTLKTSLNVVITSPLMLLGRQENRKCCFLLGVNDLRNFKL